MENHKKNKDDVPNQKKPTKNFRELDHYGLIREKIPVDKIAFHNGKLGVWED